MAKQTPELCVYTVNFPLALEHAEDMCSQGFSDETFCFASNKRWKQIADHFDRPMPLLIRDTGDSGKTRAITYVGELVDVRLHDTFPSRKGRRRWLEEQQWNKLSRYDTQEDFERLEVDKFLEFETFYLVKNIRRIERVPVGRIKKHDGKPISPDYKYGNLLCRMPPKGSKLHKTLTTKRSIPIPPISDADLERLNKRYAGTPQYQMRLVRQIQRPSPVRSAILTRYGTTCRICGYEGFRKRNNEVYAETHHMIELNKQAPHTLQSWNVIVVCPTCHKKLHFADVATSFLDPGWEVVINNEKHLLA